MQDHLAALENIFMAAVDSVDPQTLIENQVSLQGAVLCIKTGSSVKRIDLDQYEKILVIGFGKATAKMASAVEAILGGRISEGVIAVKYGHVERLAHIKTVEAGHPIPDANGVAAARQIAKMARLADEKTLVITLISGGGSALVPYPYTLHQDDIEVAISLEEKQRVTQALMACGATINEINCIRKHLSMIKGGRLAQMLYPATSISLILSDVVGDNLDVIASGPTIADSSSFTDVAAILEKYEIGSQMPSAVTRLFDLGCSGEVADTPDKDDTVFARTDNILIGTNYIALQAAEQKARALGYHTQILSSQVIGEAREVARVYCGIAKDARRNDLFGKKPICLIAGGETTVTLKGKGKGGRNQEMALSFLSEITQDLDATAGIFFLAASTDGNDGPTDAAGAFASHAILEEALQQRMSIVDSLKRNDAYTFFDTVDGLLKTGPTNTNVCDVQLLIVA